MSCNRFSHRLSLTSASRRSLLKLALAAPVVGLLDACGDGLSSNAPPVPASSAIPQPDKPAFPVDPIVQDEQVIEATVADLQGLLTRGVITAHGLTRKYLDRIAQLNLNGPALRAVIETNPAALQQAKALDLLPVASRGPLHGIPVLLKDNIDTRPADGMQTTAGSWAMVGTLPADDAPVVKRLRNAGAIILGKANLSEWSNFRSTWPEQSNGWSGRGGQTLNPYVLNADVSGSSSGPAVAVSSNLTSVALGTETDGSIIGPSAANGVVGIKPTVGLTSRVGVIPISHNQDSVGPIARTVADAAILLGVISGGANTEPGTVPLKGVLIDDYRPFLKVDGLKGARLGYSVEPPLDPLLMQVLIEQGATLIPLTDLLYSDEIRELDVLNWDFKTDLEEYLSTRVKTTDSRYSSFPVMKTLQDVIDFTTSHPELEMSDVYNQTVFETALSSSDATAFAQTNQKVARDLIDNLMSRNRIQALIINGGEQVFAPAGYPKITLPYGLDAATALPGSIQMGAGAYQEATLIQFAFALEQAIKAKAPAMIGRSLPTYRPA